MNTALKHGTDESLVKDRPAVSKAGACDCLQGLNIDAQEFADLYKVL